MNLQDRPVTSQPYMYPSPFSCVKLELETYNAHVPGYTTGASSEAGSRGERLFSFLALAASLEVAAFLLILAPAVRLLSVVPAQQQVVLQDSANLICSLLLWV